jgi:hypothetical protein
VRFTQSGHSSVLVAPGIMMLRLERFGCCAKKHSSECGYTRVRAWLIGMLPGGMRGCGGGPGAVVKWVGRTRRRSLSALQAYLLFVCERVCVFVAAQVRKLYVQVLWDM